MRQPGDRTNGKLNLFFLLLTAYREEALTQDGGSDGGGARFSDSQPVS